MKVKPEQLDKLASMLIASYRDRDLIAPTADEAALKVDAYKMFQLAKQKLAAKKGFIL